LFRRLAIWHQSWMHPLAGPTSMIGSCPSVTSNSGQHLCLTSCIQSSSRRGLSDVTSRWYLFRFNGFFRCQDQVFLGSMGSSGVKINLNCLTVLTVLTRRFHNFTQQSIASCQKSAPSVVLLSKRELWVDCALDAVGRAWHSGPMQEVPGGSPSSLLLLRTSPMQKEGGHRLIRWQE
jgi:hypothetical protein